MKKKMLSVLLTGAMMLTLAGCGSTAASSAAPEPETTVTIFIAASLEKAFTDEGKLLDMYKALQPNVTVEVNAGSSGTLLQQIQEGAPCDLFFSAGKKEKISRGDILGFLTSKGELEASEVGKIDISDHYAMVAIAAGKVANVIKKIEKEKIKNKKVKISVAKQ